MASSSIKIHSSEEVEYEGGNVHPPKVTIAFQQAPNQILPTDLGCDEPSKDPNITVLTNKLKTVPRVPAKGTTTAEKPPAPRGRAGSNRFMPYARKKPTVEKEVQVKAVPNTRKGHQMNDMLKPFAGPTGIPTAKISGPAGRLPFGIKPNPSKKPTQETPIQVKKPPLADDDMVSRVADLFGLFPAEVYPGIPKMRVSMPYLLTIYCTALQKLKDSVAGPELRIWKNEKAFKFPPIPELQAKAPGTATPNTSKCPVVPALKHFTVPGVPTPTALKVPKIPNLNHFIGPAVRKNNPFTGMPAKENFKVPSTPTAAAMAARKQEPVTRMPVGERFKFPAVPKNKLRTVQAIPTWKPKSVTGMPMGEHFKVPAAPTNQLRTAPAIPVLQPKPFRGKGKPLGDHFKVLASRRNKFSSGPAKPAKKSASALNLDVGVNTKTKDQVGEFRGFKRQIRGLQHKLYFIQKMLRNKPLSK